MAKVLISIQDEFLDKVDERAKKEKRSRCELIRQALRVYMRKRRISRNAKQGALASDPRFELLETLLME
jgi:CopG family transcriptional regulator / antitoxin EndoAI